MVPKYSVFIMSWDLVGMPVVIWISPVSVAKFSMLNTMLDIGVQLMQH